MSSFKGFLFVLAVVLVATPASAEALGDVCQRLVGSETTKCIAAANGRFVNNDAVRQCGRLVGSEVTACVGAIAGKDYSASEVQSCGGLVGSQVTDCFRRTGRAHVSAQQAASAPPSTGEIRSEIAAALGQILAGESAAAARRLQSLLDRMHS